MRNEAGSGGGTRRQFARMVFVCIGVYGVMAVISLFFLSGNPEETSRGEERVLLNEIRQLTTDAEGKNPAAAEFAALEEMLGQKQLGNMENLRAHEANSVIRKDLGFFLGLSFGMLLCGFLYIYYKILRPFYKLEKYAVKVAGGELDFPLEYERTNFFGEFTWAFDHMRKEIMTARQNEAQAIRENKTIIAALSHDIKTPVSSIRAYAEGLEAGLCEDYETRERYLQVIMKKCDEVARLVNDLVLHSLSELDRLEIKGQKSGMRGLLEDIVNDLGHSGITLRRPVPEAQLFVDEKRMAQVIGNLVENARKYAPGAEIAIWAERGKERYEIHVRDYGQGILPQDMPFIFDKFYRGANVADKPGSGLGLYIVKYIMEKMEGGIALHNHADGLEAVVFVFLKTS